jgi:predicted ATP-binding protein involved in virulence
MNQNQPTPNNHPPPAYFASLTIDNVKCFKGQQTIDLSDGNGKPALWTVILGNNNTGKTTLLRHLADYYATKNKLIVYGYGTARRMAPNSLSATDNQDTTATLFSEEATLINAEEWLLQTYLAAKSGIKRAEWQLDEIRKVLTSGILPEVKGFDIKSTENPPFNTYVLFKTDYGEVRLKELGYGYQTCLAWLADLMKRQFDRYPDCENPLAEPAIVLVDELDLHLHPEWQRQIIQFLTKQFPRTQFIVTSHSPLVVQSADQINLVLLEKVGDQVTIRQPQMTTYKGWTVEEILDELMGLEERTQSDTYLGFMKQFDEALDEDNYAKAKLAYDELAKILHPQSSQRKLLRIQMSSLVPGNLP